MTHIAAQPSDHRKPADSNGMNSCDCYLTDNLDHRAAVAFVRHRFDAYFGHHHWICIAGVEEVPDPDPNPSNDQDRPCVVISCDQRAQVLAVGAVLTKEGRGEPATYIEHRTGVLVEGFVDGIAVIGSWQR